MDSEVVWCLGATVHMYYRGWAIFKFTTDDYCVSKSCDYCIVIALYHRFHVLELKTPYLYTKPFHLPLLHDKFTAYLIGANLLENNVTRQQ